MSKGRRNKGNDAEDSQSLGSSADREEPKGKAKNKKGQKGRKDHSSGDEDESEGGVAALLDALSEKRTATREGALRGLQEVIRKEVFSEEIEDRAVELATLILSSMKKGNAKEAVLGADLLALLFVSLQGSCQEVFDMAEEALCPMARTHKSEIVTGKICETLAMGSFACGQDPSDASVLMSFVQALMLGPKTSHELLVPALRAWMLLVTSLPDSYVFERVRRLLAILDSPAKSLLEHEHVDVRVAAAEAASVCYEACWRYSPEEAKKVLTDFCEAEEEAGVAETVPELEDQMSEFDKFAAQMEAAGMSDDDSDENMQNLEIDIDLMQPVVTVAEPKEDDEGKPQGLKRSGSVKSMALVDRVKDKTVTRMARATMEGGTGPPTEKIKIRGATVEISTWRQRTWLSALRCALQSGLQNHMATNPFVHELLDIDAVAANMSALELKEDSILHRRSRAKNALVQTRDKDIGMARRKRQEMCDQSHLNDVGYDSG